MKLMRQRAGLPCTRPGREGEREGDAGHKETHEEHQILELLAVTDSLGNFADLKILSSTPLDLEW